MAPYFSQTSGGMPEICSYGSQMSRIACGRRKRSSWGSLSLGRRVGRPGTGRLYRVLPRVTEARQQALTMECGFKNPIWSPSFPVLLGCPSTAVMIRLQLWSATLSQKRSPQPMISTSREWTLSPRTAWTQGGGSALESHPIPSYVLPRRGFSHYSVILAVKRSFSSLRTVLILWSSLATLLS